MRFDRSALARRFRVAREVGLGRTLESLAQRARLRLHGVDLTQESTEAIGIDPTRGNRHDATQEISLRHAFTRLGLTGRVQSALDVGCGKGAALIAFNRLGVTRIGGVELSPRLAAICRRNLQRLSIDGQVFCTDAAAFDQFDAWQLFYLFNPFPREVLAAFLDHLRGFVRRTASTRLILFKYPQDLDLLSAPGFTIKASVPGTHPTYLVEVS